METKKNEDVSTQARQVKISNATPRYYYNTFFPSARFFFLSDGDEVERDLGLVPYT